VRLSVTDLGEDGFGLPWGQTRSWSNQLEGDYQFGNGMNWTSRELPYLGETDDGTVYVVLGFSSIRFFEPAGGNDYTPLYGARDALIYDDSGDTFTLITRTGTQWEFYGLDTPGVPAGRLHFYRTPGVETVTLDYTGQQLTQASRAYPTGPLEMTTLKYVYQYLGGGDPNAGLLERITLRRQVNSDPEVDIKRVLYSYHTGTGSTPRGNLGDLRQAQVERWDGTSWLLESGSYYRYYLNTLPDAGYKYGLRYALGSEALLRMLSGLSVLDPDAPTNTQLAQYADYFFVYDPPTRRVTSETTDAGSSTTTLVYTEASTPSVDFNEWQMKTVESRPDGSEVTVYTNYIGQVLLRELRDGSQYWRDYYSYDGDGRLIQHANPSAVIGYDDTAPGLDVDLRSDAGLIRVYSYYSTDTAPAAFGYLEYEAIKEGTGGDEVLLRTYEYGSHSNGDVTVRPVTKETVYRNEDGTGAVETSYDYPSYYSGTVQAKQRITTLPEVPTSQNGSGVAAERREYFDNFGNATFVMDERGYITSYQFDPLTQSQTRMIQDTDQDLDIPGWTAQPGAHLNLVTDYTVDDLGRTVEVLGPEHDIGGETVRTATWTVYKDLVVRSDDIAPGVFHEVWSTQGYFADSEYHVPDIQLPVSVSRIDSAGRTVAQILSTRDPEAGAKLSPDEAYDDPLRWIACTLNSFDNQSQLTDTRVYYDIPASGAGSEGTNYNTTRYIYDIMDRQDGVRSPGGTITRTTFDARGLTLTQWEGTNDNGFATTNFEASGTSNLVTVRSHVYDEGSDGGDGNLTELRLPVDSTLGNDRVTTFEYDWRNRQETVNAPENAYNISYYDNLDRVYQVDRQNGPTGYLVARSTTDFDERGQVYRQTLYAVNPTNGSVGNGLVDKFWYDASGNVIKQFPAGSWAFTKTMYDNLGRTANQYLAWDASEADTDYAAAGSVAGNTVMEQTATTYDEAGNVTFTKTLRRIHSATGTGELNLPSGSQPRGRPSYQGFWYDQVNRQTTQGTWGTNGGSDPTRPDSPPSADPTCLVSSTYDDEAGQQRVLVDAASKYTWISYDNARRQISQIDNVAIPAGPDTRITYFEYNADSLLATLTVDNSTTGNQVTQYIYGVTTTGTDNSLVARSDLLKAAIYPDPDDADDKVQYRYNRQGGVTELKDQAATIHAYEYDKLGRQTEDKVTLAGGSAVDGAVLRIQRQYNSRGLPFTITSHNATSGGSVVNQVRYDWNDFGQLQTDYQEHSGIATGSSLYVNYGYADGADNHVRRRYMVYPNNRVTAFSYGSSSTNDYRLSRPAGVTDSSGGLTYAGYTYAGARSVVKVDYTEPDVIYNLATGVGNDPYDGLDQFDRVATAYWRRYGGTPADMVKINYTYDLVSSRTTREDVLAKLQSPAVYQDELYGYDGLDRLIALDRGELSGSSISNKQFGETWGLDQTGNWSTYVRDTDGAGTLNPDQDRTHTEANELEFITTNAGTAWPDPLHDRTGNMIKMPRPSSLANYYLATYDAWNRLVKVTDGTNPVAEYAYDGVNRRTVKKRYSSGSLTETRDFYYSDQWQVIEERLATTVVEQFIWGIRYVDDLILRDRDVGAGVIERLYACQDANFNVVALTDTGGFASLRFGYDAYGVPEPLDPQFGPTSNTTWEVRYAGYRWDRETGLYQVRNRALHPALGRWCTRDPLGFSAGVNLYEYTRSRPLSALDPTGTRDKQREKVQSDRLVYSCNCGWIDWSHASTTSSGPLWAAIKNEAGTKSADGSGFRVRAKLTSGFPWFLPSFNKDFYVKYGLSSQDKKAHALYIWEYISFFIESIQSLPPLSWYTTSGFSEEDLPSNLIGFYMAVEGFSEDDIRKICVTLSRAESLKIYDRYKMGKNFGWTPIYHPTPCCPHANQWPKQLDTVKSAATRDWRAQVVPLGDSEEPGYDEYLHEPLLPP